MAAEPSPACAAKRADIQAQLSEATAQKRKHEVAGLQKALKANQANCTDASLAKDRDRDIKQAQKKVAERERSLAEAERKGDAKKIADRQAKLEAARSGLARAERPISQ
ncbi:MAG: DUF1090 domain-containing protein [Comamonadaceae bacterium]|nr:MAG: DUF1090 domain-containing protein [Comamonadaceae bacterium]